METLNTSSGISVNIPNQYAFDILNDLALIYRDEEKIFKAASQAITDLNLKEILEQYAFQRKEFATALKTEAAKYRNPQLNVVLTQKMQYDFETKLASCDAKEILKECVKGENAAINFFEDIVKQSHLPVETKFLLLKQYGNIKETIYQLNLLSYSISNYLYS